MSKEKVIGVKNLKKSFKDISPELVIFDDVSLDIFRGEKVAILGSSGSGKSTFLSLLAGLDKADQGEINVLGEDIGKISFDALSDYRNNKVSIIFQSFELIAPFNAIENVSAPLNIRGGIKKEEIKNTSERILEEVGLSDRKKSFPNTLSGGERQRIAIARALASDTPIILADEPTGSLDIKTGQGVLNLLLEEVEKREKTLVIITHDLKIAERMDRVFEVKDKKLYEREKSN